MAPPKTKIKAATSNRVAKQGPQVLHDKPNDPTSTAANAPVTAGFGRASKGSGGLPPKSMVVDAVKAEKMVIVPKRDISTFAWEHCGGDSPSERLRIKEDAVRQAFHRCDEAAKHLEHMLQCASMKKETVSGSNVFTIPPTSPVVYDSIPDIKSWLQQFEDVQTRHTKFRVLVGFAGVTGAGKTSAINSILRQRNLLPSSNEAAATAVPCVIEYNHDEQHAFRAEISFRERADIAQDLDRYFSSLSQRLARLNVNESFDDDDDAYNDIEEEVEEDIQETLEMVSSVFGLDEDELAQETRDSIFAKNPAVLQLLGTTHKINESDASLFAERIRPYMDSVEGEHYGRRFAAWPLIREAKIFVRSDVLKNGTVLVDLPGLADNVESRSAVASEYLRKLDILAVVTPVIRARNERTGVQLMSDHQALCMQMDGKYHKNSICVILSKMDDMDVGSFLHQHRVAVDQDPMLQACLARHKLTKAEFRDLNEEKQEIERAIGRITKDLHVAGLRPRERETLQKKKDQKEAEKTEVASQIVTAMIRASQAEGQILYWCIKLRNAKVQADIQTDFSKRQGRIPTQNKELYDGKVSMFPISASAFWNVQENEINRPVGFPTMNYTGVPALTHWLRYATAPAREKHLDTILNALNSLLNLMKAWSCNTKLDLTNDFVEKQVMHMPLHKLHQSLNLAFRTIKTSIKQIDPMKNKSTVLGNCKQKCVDVVSRWHAKDPSRPATAKGNKMAWSTYHVCVRRKGAPYRSRGAGRPRFAWIESLCNLFYEGVVEEWNSALNEQLPALKAPALKAIDSVWTNFLKQLRAAVEVAAPEAWALFEAELHSFDQIREVVKDEVTKKFDNLSAQAGRIHRNIKTLVHHKMDPAFTRAAMEHGRGMYERQRRAMLAQARLRGTNMFRDSVDDIDRQLKASFNSIKKEFDHVIDDAIRRVKLHVRMMLDERMRVEEKTRRPVSPRVEGLVANTQLAVGRVVSEWQAQWRIGDYVDLTIEDTCYAIPDLYCEDNEDEAMEKSSPRSVIEVDAPDN